MRVRDWKPRKAAHLTVGFALLLISLSEVGASAQASRSASQNFALVAQSGAEAPANKSSSDSVPSGAQLYKRYCAACHGNDLKGNGSAPPPFKDVPPDLTTLAQRHGGKFPDDYVTGVLRNGVPIPAHAPPEMPTWDADFKAGYGLSEAQVSARIANLKNYIKSRQAK